MNILLCIVAVCITVSQGKPFEGSQAPERCTTPKQFESSIGLVTGMQKGTHGSLQQVYGNLSYDVTNKRLAQSLTVITGVSPISVRIIQNYKTKMMFLISGGICMKSEMSNEMPESLLPANATFLTKSEMGVGTNMISIQNWQVLYKDYDQKTIIGVSDDQNCIPVSSMSFGGQVIQAEGAPALSVMGFTNVQLGIKDPSVFTPPAICDKVHPEHIQKYYSPAIHKVLTMHH